MAIIRWYNRPELNRPLGELERLQREMNQLFSGFFGRAPEMVQPAVFPALNVSEDENNLYVRAELPGINPKDVEISVEGDTLTLRGERKLEETSEGINYHRREREAGRFRRIVTFPVQINPEAADATFKNGVLKLVLPKAEEAKPKQITVKTE